MRYIGGQKRGELVSIIIPVWGRYKCFLEECLESVYQQTYKNYEIIVVDDKTDLPSARNCGIIRAKGEWILILDVDNKLTPEFIEKTIDKGDIVATHHQFFGDNNGTFRPGEPKIEDFMSGNQIDANALYRKSVWEDVGGYDESMKDGWEDYDFWLRCMAKGYKITVIPELLFLYRKHGETMATTAGRKSGELQKYIIDKYKKSLCNLTTPQT